MKSKNWEISKEDKNNPEMFIVKLRTLNVMMFPYCEKVKLEELRDLINKVLEDENNEA